MNFSNRIFSLAKRENERNVEKELYFHIFHFLFSIAIRFFSFYTRGGKLWNRSKSLNNPASSVRCYNCRIIKYQVQLLGWLGTFRRVRKILSNGSFIIRYEYVIYLTRERLAPEGFRSVSARSAIRVRFMRHMLWDVFLFFFFFARAQLLSPESREFKNATDAFKYDAFARRSLVSGIARDPEMMLQRS